MSFRSVSVIIPARNRATLIHACLARLLVTAQSAADSGVDIEVVVANDASTDDTGSVVDSFKGKGPATVRQVTLPERSGPARARNAALEVAIGELVIFVDSDVVVTPGFFEAHLAQYERDTDRYAVGALISVPTLDEALVETPPSIWDYSGATLDTANASVPMEALRAVDFFDSGFEGMGWQDLDLGRRLQNHGLARVQAKGAVAYHIQPPISTQAQLEARIQKERERGVTAVRYMIKHPGLSSKLAAQDTVAHQVINWFFRMGGFIHEQNVLKWVEWARRRGWKALEKVWLAGVINQAHLQSLKKTKEQYHRR